MPFETLEATQRAGRQGMPASVSVRQYRGGQRPGTYVALSAEMTRKLKVKKDERFSVHLGVGEHRGLLRLKRDAKAGIVTPKLAKGAALFSLGFIEQFGTEAREKEFTNAELLDADMIEIVLPGWSSDRPKPVVVATSSATPKVETMREKAERENRERRKRLGLG